MPSWLAGVDWAKVLLPNTPLLEVVVRGSLVYLGSFAMLRLVLRREFGALGIPDVIVIVFIADAAQNGMAGSYLSVTDGLVLVATLMFWAYALDWASYHLPWFERLLKPQPIPLVVDGRLMRANMRREFVTETELMTAIREHGVDDLAAVRKALLEPNGEITVLGDPREPDRPPKPRRV